MLNNDLIKYNMKLIKYNLKYLIKYNLKYNLNLNRIRNYFLISWQI